MPLITLSSDIGTQDYMPAAIKGRLMQTNEAFQIIDITHKLSPFNFPQAAYLCRSAIKNFPPDSFHIILVNVFDRKNEHLLFAEHEGQFIGCADNGLLTMILNGEPEKVIAIPLKKSQEHSILAYAQILAETFNEVLAGQKLHTLGDNTVQINVKRALLPTLGSDWMEGQILFIDNFENVVVNISKDDFETHRKGRSFKIVFRRDEVIDKLCQTYSDVPEGEKLAMFNSAGFLEIAINKGNAAGLFGLKVSPESVNNTLYQTVKIFFQ